MKKGKEKEDFRCSKTLKECLRGEEIITKKSRYDIIEEAVWKYLKLDENEKGKDIKTGKNETEITFPCSQELRNAMDEEGEKSNKLGKYISNDEIIRHALYFYFGAKNEKN